LFEAFHSLISIYDPNQVGHAFITLLAGSEVETGNAGTVCALRFLIPDLFASPHMSNATRDTLLCI
jgi:hypothetical protein